MTYPSIPWRRCPLAVALAMALAPAPLRSQEATPTPTPEPAGQCVADQVYHVDVRNVADARGANWELRRLGLGQAGSVEQAEVVAEGGRGQRRFDVPLDLRGHGSVLDGSRFYFRARAMSSSTQPAAEWSAPVVFDADATTDGMYTAEPEGSSIRLDWSLSGDIGACADGIEWRLFADSPSGPPLRTGTDGTSGVFVSATVVPGPYYVRVGAVHGGSGDDDRVGREGEAIPVTVESPLAAEDTPTGPDQPPVVTVGTFQTADPGTQTTFVWEELKTVCDFGRLPGSDTLPFEKGAYQIPENQFNASRRCVLWLVWTNPSPTFNVSQEAVLQGRGEVVTESGQVLGGVGSYRAGNTVKAELPLGELPPDAFRAGLQIERANGEVHVAFPQYRTFARGAVTEFEPPAITSFQINGGAASTTNNLLQLDLETTGSQPTEIMISQSSLFQGAAWKPYAPVTGAFGGQQTYSLGEQASGTKTLSVKVRSGYVVSNVMSDAIDYAHLVEHVADSASVLQFAEDNGFRHSASALDKNIPFFGITTRCEVDVTGAGAGAAFTVEGDVGNRCSFQIFQDRQLNEGWEVLDIRPIHGSGTKLETERAASGRSAEVHFTLEILDVNRILPFQIPKAVSDRYGIEVRLRGPAEQSWQDAFRK